MARTGPGIAALAVCGIMGYGVLSGHPDGAPLADTAHADAIEIAANAFPRQTGTLHQAMAVVRPIVLPKSFRDETRLALLGSSLFDAATSESPGPYAQPTLDSTFVPAPQVDLAQLEPPPATPEPLIPLPPVAQLESDPLVDVPMPQPRPPELREPAVAMPAPVARMARLETAAPQVAPAAPAGPTFFDKLFGGDRPSSPALAYAAPETSVVSRLQGMTSTATANDHVTAVYDIAAHTVYLPDGTRLEAHSGLGERLDDPRYVRDRMRGPTPPALYELTLRESLFHGVQALRLTPVAGGDTYGRGGLLAHTFMLGPRGDSNGCVVFRNYRAFLDAYASGQIRHLQVVASLR